MNRAIEGWGGVWLNLPQTRQTTHTTWVVKHPLTMLLSLPHPPTYSLFFFLFYSLFFYLYSLFFYSLFFYLFSILPSIPTSQFEVSYIFAVLLVILRF